MALSDICELFLGKPLRKSQQVSNWSQRPLSASQTEYAALDAHCLLPLTELILVHHHHTSSSSSSSSSGYIKANADFNDSSDVGPQSPCVQSQTQTQNIGVFNVPTSLGVWPYYSGGNGLRDDPSSYLSSPAEENIDFIYDSDQLDNYNPPTTPTTPTAAQKTDSAEAVSADGNSNINSINSQISQISQINSQNSQSVEKKQAKRLAKLKKQQNRQNKASVQRWLEGVNSGWS